MLMISLVLWSIINLVIVGCDSRAIFQATYLVKITCIKGGDATGVLILPKFVISNYICVHDNPAGTVFKASMRTIQGYVRATPLIGRYTYNIGRHYPSFSLLELKYEFNAAEVIRIPIATRLNTFVAEDCVVQMIETNYEVFTYRATLMRRYECPEAQDMYGRVVCAKTRQEICMPSCSSVLVCDSHLVGTRFNTEDCPRTVHDFTFIGHGDYFVLLELEKKGQGYI